MRCSQYLALSRRNDGRGLKKHPCWRPVHYLAELNLDETVASQCRDDVHLRALLEITFACWHRESIANWRRVFQEFSGCWEENAPSHCGNCAVSEGKQGSARRSVLCWTT